MGEDYTCNDFACVQAEGTLLTSMNCYHALHISHGSWNFTVRMGSQGLLVFLSYSIFFTNICTPVPTLYYPAGTQVSEQKMWPLISFARMPAQGIEVDSCSGCFPDLCVDGRCVECTIDEREFWSFFATPPPQKKTNQRNMIWRQTAPTTMALIIHVVKTTSVRGEEKLMTIKLNPVARVRISSTVTKKVCKMNQ